MLNLSKIRAITLDLDDTLWPVLPTIARAEAALNEWLTRHAPRTASLCADAEFRKRIRAEVNRRYSAQAHDLSFLRREAIRESLLCAGDPGQLAEVAFEVFFAERQNVTLYPGIEEALSRLSARYPLVGLSNGNANVFATPAGPYFRSAVNARMCGVAKPHARIFQMAAMQLNLSVEEVLHVGDDPNTDVMGAINAGMQTVWINTHGLDWSCHLDRPMTVGHLLELCDHLQA